MSSNEAKEGKAARSAAVRKRVLLVDGHALVRGALAQMINLQPDLTCLEANDAREALRQTEGAPPHLVVTELSFGNDLHRIQDIRSLYPQWAVLILSIHDEVFYAEQALEAGARGYVMKSAGGEAILQAIRLVLDGRIFVSERLQIRHPHIFSAWLRLGSFPEESKKMS